MAATPSTMLPLGTAAPAFSLPDTRSWSGKGSGGGASTVTLADLSRGKRGTVVMFLCNHCPFVKHIRAEVARFGKDYQAREGGGFAIAAISSNDIETHPADSPDLMKKEAAEAGYTFPYLYDHTQETAKAYRAACTPDFFVFNDSGKLAYRGQLDDSRPGNGIPVTGKDLRAACDALLANKEPAANQMPSIGCNIKWRAGSKPEYA